MYQFHNVRFPDDIAYGSSGGPGFFTIIHTQKNGKEFRNINWQQARLQFNIAYGVKTRKQMDTIMAFFRARMGRAYSFRFKDWSDFRADTVIKVDGKECQLIKIYSSGDNLYERIITKPVKDTVKITVDDMPIEFELDELTGKITLAEEATEIRAIFEFDVPVRFETDNFMASLSHSDSFQLQNINLIEVKE